jgi:Raf kinase inhibitor-like YbhB/YbcL family protein
MPLADRFPIALSLLALTIGCGTGAPEDQGMSLTAPTFTEDNEIPSRYTCVGENLSPPLEWSELPAGTESLALIIDDPDAPGGTAVHWVLYNIAPSLAGLPETEWGDGLPEGVREGLNDFGRTQYGGPCPPSGRHRYFHKLYALDTVLSDLGNPDKSQLEQAMQDHVLAEAELVATYARGD